MAEQIVELAPGESKQVSFEAIPIEAKAYQVSVDGMTGSFTAKSTPAVMLDFSNISVYGICLVKFSSIGTDPDGVPFGVLKDKLSLNSLQRLSVQWRNKTVAIGVNEEIIDGGFMVSFLVPGGTQVIDLAPVFFGWSNITDSPAPPYDASALLRYVIGTGAWDAGDYDAELEFMTFFDRADIYSAWVVPPIFRVRNLLHCTSGGSAG